MKDKQIKEQYDIIMSKIPKENHDIVDGLLGKLSLAYHPNEDTFIRKARRIQREVVEQYKDVIYSTFEFQIANGHIYDGAFEIVINNHIAKIVSHRITVDIKHAIKANGGKEVKEVSVQKVKPAKWTDKESELKPTSEFIDEVKFTGKVTDDSTSS